MPVNYEFPQACVIYKEEPDAQGRVLPRLYVQTIDSYRRQRELTVEQRVDRATEEERLAGERDETYWEYHAYKHPGVREKTMVPDVMAKAFISRFIDLCATYPQLLFNKSTHERPRHEGFVELHDLLLEGAGMKRALKALG